MRESHRTMQVSRNFPMLSYLTKEEQAFIREQAEIRVMAKKWNTKQVSRYSNLRVVEMGIAGEFAMAKALGCMFDPWLHMGRGDGHRRDLWRGDITLSVKTRHGDLRPDFLYPPKQQPETFHDDYGVVGLWVEPYSVLELVGYLPKEAMNAYVIEIPVSGSKSGRTELRNGIPAYRFRPIDRLVEILEQVTDEEVHTAQTQGYIRYFRNGGCR